MKKRDYMAMLGSAAGIGREHPWRHKDRMRLGLQLLAEGDPAGGVQENETAFYVKISDIPVVVGEGYNTDGDTAFGAGTGNKLGEPLIRLEDVPDGADKGTGEPDRRESGGRRKIAKKAEKKTPERQPEAWEGQG